MLEHNTEEGEGSKEEEEPELSCIALSQFAAMGLTQPKTMKVIAIINGVVIVVLIDSGATHNFISRELASKLGLLLDKKGIYSVTLGDGKKQSTLGKCKGVKVSIGDYDTIVDTLVFELGGIDMVLGISWLATLGDVQTNWQNQTMKFQTPQGPVVIKWDPSLDKSLISPQQLLKLIEVEGVALVWNSQDKYEENAYSLGSLEGNDKVGDIEQLLKQYAIVFKEPEGLPPKREVDHKIPIKSGEGPINVRPYRYPHLQKNEIERQVEEMLQAGIIRPSNSPYSSPVILVQKKDGS